ncbi:MAG: c-type cytochrome [Acidobacteriota bacterium]
MKVPIVLKIAVLAVAATAFYTYVGQLVPQKEVYPPVEREIDKKTTPEKMAEIGREIFEGKALCSTCHTLGQTGALRFPDLSGIGSRAATRVPGLSGLQYLTHSLYQPDEFIVAGFTPGMPTINKPPIGLTEDEIKSVIAYLQTLGGTLTMTMGTQLPIPGREVPVEAPSVAPAAAPATASAAAGPLQRFQCSSCHNLDQPGRLEAVSLHDVGTRLKRDAILAAMLSEHRQEEFFQQANLDDLRQMVDLLAAKGGN